MLASTDKTVMVAVQILLVVACANTTHTNVQTNWIGTFFYTWMLFMVSNHQYQNTRQLAAILGMFTIVGSQWQSVSTKLVYYQAKNIRNFWSKLPVSIQGSFNKFCN